MQLVDKTSLDMTIFIKSISYHLSVNISCSFRCLDREDAEPMSLEEGLEATRFDSQGVQYKKELRANLLLGPSQGGVLCKK